MKDNMMNKQQELRKRVERQARRMKKAEHDRPTLTGQTVYIGALGLLFVLPVIGGAYLEPGWMKCHPAIRFTGPSV
jgi:ATP synthase protein I